VNATDTSSQIVPLLGPHCRDDQRRVALIENAALLNLNGIDYVEFDPTTLQLAVHFLLPLAAGAYGLLKNGAAFSSIRIEGGTRIIGVTATNAAAAGSVLTVDVSAQGDFSPYWLSIGWRRAGASWSFDLPGVDRQFSVAPVDFRPNCPSDVDCAPLAQPPAPPDPGPALDYMAKDYASFRAMLLDLVAQRNPSWIERHAADVGIELLELLAYEGDAISYFQDAVANEATLDSARKRVSAKRHARLVDYHMHDGRNAWTWAQFQAGTTGAIPRGTRVVTKLSAPPAHMTALPGPMIDTVTGHVDQNGLLNDSAFRSARIFETSADLDVDPLRNGIVLHTWGSTGCCLAAGTTLAHAFAVDAAKNLAVPTGLKRGDWLVLEEVRGRETALEADADPAHRVVVQIVNDPAKAALTDPVFACDLVGSALTGYSLQPFQTGKQPLAVEQIEWRAVDALPFELCLNLDATVPLASSSAALARAADPLSLAHITVARGNTVLADHGLTIDEHFPVDAHGVPSAYDPPIAANERFELELGEGPLTMVAPPGAGASDAVASVTLTNVAGFPDNPAWNVAQDLLEAHDTDPYFVVDVNDDGRGIVRFGDGDYGRSVAGATAVDARYRVGNGAAGNVGANAFAHVLYDSTKPFPTVTAVRNPLPARDGTNAETIEEVRQFAPAAFHARQYRAVTEADYTAAALTLAGVHSAVATFHWTGSWYTVFLGVEPSDPRNVLTDQGARTTHLDPAFAAAVEDGIARFRLAGYDLDVRSGQYVALDVALHLCVNPDYFRTDVVAAVARALGPGGFFAAGTFTFGQPLYASRLYAAASAVEGVDSVEITALQRFGRDAAGELEAGVVTAGPWEILRLDNDPNRRENGVLAIAADGGK
jgi:hypothetical protein